MKFREQRHLCVLCRKRVAKFVRPWGRVRLYGHARTVSRDKDHNLCRQCYESAMDSNRARREGGDGD